MLYRLILFFLLAFYCASLSFSHSTYLVWQDYIPFFHYSNFSSYDFILIFFLVFIATSLLPLRLKVASDIFCWILLLFLYIPICVIYLGQTAHIYMSDLITVFCVILSFFLIALPGLLTYGNESSLIVFYLNKKLPRLIIIFWIFLLAILLANYHGIMSIRGLGSIYEQRSLGKASSLLLGYAQTYFGYVLSVALIALGLFNQRIFLVALGWSGCLILYAITAERTIFLLPVLLFFVYKLACYKKQFLLLFIFLAMSSLYFDFIALYGDSSKLTKDVGFYYLTRVVATPGLFYINYQDYFREVGYTYFSHIKGFNLFIDVPVNFKVDPLYPELGRIVARDVHHINSNSNASFLSTDGVASLGNFGVVLVSIFMSLVLFFLNIMSSRWPKKFVLPLMAPIALLLTNGSLFTALISFGLLFWILIFSIMGRKF